MNRIVHPLEPVFDPSSRVLVLGTMPSPKSREQGFYYMHPQNRFWKVMGIILQAEIPTAAEDKRALLLHRGIALWDVLSSCEIAGAEDASIRAPEANDLGRIFRVAQIRAVFTTGKAATHLYEAHCRRAHPQYPPARYLPSTSAANAGCSLEALAESYRAILPELVGTLLP